MASRESIAARREVALQRITRSLKLAFADVRGSAEDRHVGELEQIADHLDPDNRVAPASPEAARFTAREGPPPSHEEAVAASMPSEPTVVSPEPLTETSDERENPTGRDDRQPVQGGGRTPAARGDRQRNPRPR